MTSDVFNNKGRKERPQYAIVGSDGLRIPFSFSGLYDSQTEEAMALSRASNLHASLYRRDNDGRIFHVTKDGLAIRVDKKALKEATEISRDMMNNNNYVPGIQANIYG